MSILRRFFTARANVLAVLLIISVLVVAAAAPRLAPLTPDGQGIRTDLGNFSFNVLPEPPSAAHPLGTVEGGADVYTVVIWGTRDALRFGLTVTLATALGGVAVGAVSAYVGGP